MFESPGLVNDLMSPGNDIFKKPFIIQREGRDYMREAGERDSLVVALNPSLLCGQLRPHMFTSRSAKSKHAANRLPLTSLVV